MKGNVKTFGEIASFHRMNSTQLMNHWSVVLKSLNAHDLCSLYSFQYTSVLYNTFSFSTSVNCDHLCSQPTARTKVYWSRGTAICMMNIQDLLEIWKVIFQWLQQVWGKGLVFKAYAEMSFSWFFIVSPISRKTKVLTKKEALFNTYLVKVYVIAV